VLNAGDSWLDGQARFHAHRWPQRPELSVRMARRGARTVSRSVVDVDPAAIRFEYASLPAPGAVH
jgi:hypothetical protein